MSSWRRTPRRDSVANATVDFQRDLERTLEKLREIWDRVGFVDKVRGDRIATVYVHLRSLLDEMVAEESEMSAEIEKKIKSHTDGIVTISRKLQMTTSMALMVDGLTLVEKEAKLRAELTRLHVELESRLLQKAELESRAKELCGRFHLPSATIPSKVPIDSELRAFATRLDKWDQDLRERTTALTEWRTEVRKMRQQLGKEAPSEELQKLMTADLDSIVLSSSVMTQLREIQGDLKAEYEAYIRDCRQKIQRVKRELEEMWEKCHVSEKDRHGLPTMDEENFSESALRVYEAEVERWRVYYQSLSSVLSAVDAWEQLWKEKVANEANQGDLSRYNNRGGQLEAQLKRARVVEERLLPKARLALMEAVSKWKEERVAEELLIHGMEPMAYIEQIQIRHDEQKKAEKRAKEMEKKRQLENETVYGTTPTKIPRRSPLKPPTPRSASKRKGPTPSKLAPPPTRAPGLPTGQTPLHCRRPAMTPLSETKRVLLPTSTLLTEQEFKESLSSRPHMQSSRVASPSSSSASSL